MSHNSLAFSLPQALSSSYRLKSGLMRDKFHGQLHMCTKSVKSYLVSVGNLSVDIHLPISEYPIQEAIHQPLTSTATLSHGGAYNALLSANRLGLTGIPFGFIPHLDVLPPPSELDHRLLIRHDRAHTPTCAALVDPHGRHTFLASNEHPTTASQIVIDQPLTQKVINHVKNATAILIDGYALHSDLQLVENVLHLIKQFKIPLWMDPQPAAEYLLNNKQKHPKESQMLLQLFQSATGISMNTEEAEYLISRSVTNNSELHSHSVSDPNIAMMITEFFPNLEVLLIKNGSEGSSFAQRNSQNSWNLQHVPPCLIPKESLKDTIGAGDAFIGAFLASKYIHKLSTYNACHIGNAMGATTCLNISAGIQGIGNIAACKELIQKTYPHLLDTFESILPHKPERKISGHVPYS